MVPKFIFVRRIGYRSTPWFIFRKGVPFILTFRKSNLFIYLECDLFTFIFRMADLFCNSTFVEQSAEKCNIIHVATYNSLIQPCTTKHSLIQLLRRKKNWYIARQKWV